MESPDDPQDLALWARVPPPCPLSSPSSSCWAPSGCCLTGQQLLLSVPPLGAPSSPGLWCRERRGCPQVPHPWLCTLTCCSSAGAVLGCSASSRGRFPLGGTGKCPGPPHLLPDGCTVSFSLSGLFSTQPFPAGSAHTVPVLKLSHAEEEEGECLPCAFSPRPPFLSLHYGAGHIPAFWSWARRDNPSVATLPVPGGFN